MRSIYFNYCLKSIIIFSLIFPISVFSVEEPVIDHSKPEYLFVLSGLSGSFKDNQLILNDVGAVVYFSDRPYLVSGHYRLQKFVDNWEQGGHNNFLVTPPNAVLSIFTKDEMNNVTITLSSSKPIVKGNTIIFKDIIILEGNIPETFMHSSVFFDPTDSDPGSSVV